MSRLIMRWPRSIPAGTVINSLVQLADLSPTLLRLAGGTPASGAGHDLSGLVAGMESDPGASSVYAEETLDGHNLHALVTASRKLIIDAAQPQHWRLISRTTQGAPSAAWRRPAGPARHYPRGGGTGPATTRSLPHASLFLNPSAKQWKHSATGSPRQRTDILPMGYTELLVLEFFARRDEKTLVPGSARLCLERTARAAQPRFSRGTRDRNHQCAVARQSLADRAFPGRAWERGDCSFCCLLLSVAGVSPR